MVDHDDQGGGYDTDDTPTTGKGLRAELERALERARDAEERAKRVDVLEREIAFYKADLGGLTDKQRKALLGAHEGEMTPESLQATATELGFVKTDSKSADDEPAETFDDEVNEIGSLSDSPVDYERPETQSDLAARMANATSQEEVLQILADAGMLMDQG